MQDGAVLNISLATRRKAGGLLDVFRGPFRGIVLCGLGLMVAIAIGTSAMVGTFRGTAVENTKRSLESAVLLLARHFDQQIGDFSIVQNEIIQELRSYGTYSPELFAGEIATLTVHELLRGKINGWGDVAGVNIFDSNGVLVNSSQQWPVPDIRISDRNYFRVLKSGVSERLAIEIVQGRFSSDSAIVFGRSIVGPKGEFLGVATRAINPGVFEAFFASADLGDQAAVSIHHRRGELLARYPRDGSRLGESFRTGSPLQQSFFENDRATSQIISPIDNRDRLISSRALAEFPLVVIATTTVDASLSEWRRQTLFFISVAALSLIVIATVLYLIVRQMARLHDHSQRRLNVETTRLARAINHMTQGLLLFDSDHRLVVCNDRYLRMYGLSLDAIHPGCSLRDVVSQRKESGSLVGNIEEHCSLILKNVQGSRTHIVETADRRLIQIANEPVDDGGWLSIHDDITDRHRTNERIAHLAHYDSLTDLPNRTLFRERVEQRLTRNEQFAVFYIDVDQFKTVNDSLGHQVGDELLKTIAGRLQACMGATDVVARLGGDEFAILRSELLGHEELVGFIHTIHESIRTPYECLGHQITSDASIGVSLSPSDGTSMDHLLRNADLAMYAAKADGRRVYRFFEPAMDARAKARRTLEIDLRAAIRDGAMEVHYQPLVDLGTNDVTCCEALLRWRHPERGMVSPADFIPIAEETGLINELGEWVLKTACKEAAAWPDSISVAVNVSPVQFRPEALALKVASALADSGLSARRLELEITEAVLIADDENTLDTLHKLRDIGVRIALDDFGTGYSSLSYLQLFPFDKIKIDRSFVANIAEPDGSAPIVEAVVNIAKARRMTTTAEGVETTQQRELVRTLGCTHMQGYLFSAAMPANLVRQMFARTDALSI
jgi:diguanylate cyclase (GGDEF)-like protein